MGDAAVIYLTERFVSMGACITCGVTICAPESFYAQRHRDQKGFHCVNGHSQHYVGETDEQKLRKQLESAQQRIAEVERRRREEADRAGRQIAAARGQVTKIKNRVGNGVCPCCNRTFQNLMRHMSTKHPDFKHAGTESESTPHDEGTQK